MRTICTTLILVGLSVSSAAAQKWARDMFDHTSHDFGTVARGAKVEHRFALENIYEEDAHISSIRSSCGCTTPQIGKRTLKTWDKVDVVAKIDTRGYYGRKDATLTVVFDKPFPAEVQLKVHTYIRSDVVVQPGSVQFGSVQQGSPQVRKVKVSYAGRRDWRIVRVESNNPHLSAQVVPVAASPGEVRYELVVKLGKDAPVGYLRDHLVLVTNDLRAQASRVPVAIEGVVVEALTVRPSPLSVVAKVGETLTKRLVVQAKAPFRIKSVSCDDKRFQFTVPQTEGAVHVITAGFSAGDSPSKGDAKIRIETDAASGRTLEVPVSIRVMPKGPVAF